MLSWSMKQRCSLPGAHHSQVIMLTELWWGIASYGKWGESTDRSCSGGGFASCMPGRIRQLSWAVIGSLCGINAVNLYTQVCLGFQGKYHSLSSASSYSWPRNNNKGRFYVLEVAMFVPLYHMASQKSLWSLVPVRSCRGAATVAALPKHLSIANCWDYPASRLLGSGLGLVNMEALSRASIRSL